jgi:hypothetical protein
MTNLEGTNKFEVALSVRLFLLLVDFFEPCNITTRFNNIFHRFLYKALCADNSAKEILIQWFTNFYPKERFERLVVNYHDMLAATISIANRDESSLFRLCNIMDMLYASNRRKIRVKYTAFYNDKVNNDREYKKVINNLTQ